ncbi:MAG: hypothetical protein LKE28_04510 [Sphaerochaeta sp.]|jgi:hypothetical protein|nr:hypothetical protein [Sphaerochaeta sp.]
MFLGDLLVTITIFILTVWYIAMATHPVRTGEEKTVLDEATTYIERNKDFFGLAVIIVAVVHFCVPMLVLL